MPQADGETGRDAGRVDAAIARVLQAERDARASVERCAREAEALVDEAHERARQIARSAAQRSARVQRWSAAMLQRELDKVAREQSQIERVVGQSYSPEQLRRAVDRLAAQITGAER